MINHHQLTREFKELSQRLGSDPMQIQGPGGNTSIKSNGVMWVKASGTNLADAIEKNIFVALDHSFILSEIIKQSDDSSLKNAVLYSEKSMRPSIETTFHALLDWPVVVHTHSIAAISHATSGEGIEALCRKLDGIPFAVVPYAKPGIPITNEIKKIDKISTNVFILKNHGLICCGENVSEVSALIQKVEKLLALSPRQICSTPKENTPPPDGFVWSEYSWLAQDPHAFEMVLRGSYYPDHVVFLGPSLPTADSPSLPPVILSEGKGVLIRKTATASQKAMLRCLFDVLVRVEAGWQLEPIGRNAELELMDWDAEAHRISMAEGK